MVGRRQLARQYDVAIQDRACLVGDRLGHVIPLHQHGIEGGDGAFVGLTRPLHQAGQGGKHRRGVTAPGGGFAGGQADFTLGAGEAGDGVHQQQHLLALIPEIFGDGGGDKACFGPLHGRAIRGGDHQHCLLETLFPQIRLDKLPHLPSPLPDKGKYCDIHFGAADE
ncbi:hypothetical protein D3C78_1407350 [compost metagenome]